MSRAIHRVIASLAAGWLVQSSVCMAEETRPAYRLGIFPFVSAERIESAYGPLAISLGHALQRPIKLRTRASFEAYLESLMRKDFDIALVQPFDYIKIAGKGRYLPLLRLDLPLMAIVVVADQGPIREVAQLRGQTIAAPPASAAVSYLAGPMLEQAGLPSAEVKLQYTSTHDECMLKVLQGRAAACVTSREAMALYATRRGFTFRVLVESIPLPHILFVACADMPQLERHKLQQELRAWFDSDEARRLLPGAAGGGGGGLVPALDSDYDVVRSVHDAQARH